MADDDVPESLEAINFKINATTDESLESTRRMIALCEESKDAGVRTLVMLDDQGEQLENVDKGLGTINADMREAEEQLAGMEKCCGLFTLPWNKQSDPLNDNPEYQNAWKDNQQGADVQGDQPRVQLGGEGFVAAGGYVTKITDDAKEGEMDENLGQVNNMVGNLRNMAIDMSSEVTNQNRQLDRINIKTDSNNQRVAAANKRTAKLAK